MGANRRAGDRDSRGVSNQVAVILLIGMVVTGAVTISIVGTQSLTELEDQVRGESTEKSMREVDARVSSLAVESSATRASLNFGDHDAEDVTVSQRGHVNVSVDDRHQCTANVSLSSIRIDQGGDQSRAYEMGGIWTADGNASSMASPPQLRFEEGALALTVTQFTGTVNQDTEPITKNVTGSNTASRRIQSTLQQSTCARPDNVTVTIQSDYHDAYHRYAQDEFDGPDVSHWEDNRTVRIYIGQDELPPATNDARNQVVNLSGSAYNDVETKDNSIEVEKGAPVNYTLAARPIAQGVEVSEIHDFEDQTVYRQPLDVVFVVDESGSMADSAGDKDKYQAARDSMKTFLGLLDESKDRAGLVGFYADAEGRAHYYPTDREYLTNDFDAMNSSTIPTTEGDDQFDGGTYIHAGVREGSVLFDLVSNSSREKVMIVLSDGENTEDHHDDDTREWANRAAEQGTAIYTIGFGDGNLDEDLLEDMAEGTGGGYYYAENSSELTDVFQDIATQVTQTEAVARPPVSVDISTGSQTYYPQVGGNASQVANATGADGEPVPNVNDPTAPDFSFALTVPDGTNISMNSMAYDCAEGEWEATSRTVVNETTNETYLVTRCTELDESTEEVLEPSDVSIYTDGDDLSSLVDEREAWFQADLNETLIPYRDGTTADLPSNQAIVVFDYEDDDKANNRLVMLFQLGYAESQRSAGSAVRVTVNEVEIGT